MMAQVHPERLALHNEVHARPYESIDSPCTLLHWVYETIGEDASDIVAHLSGLMKAHHLPAPDIHSSQVTVDMPSFRLRWERHAEFVTYTAWKMNASAADLHNDLPQEWLKNACGRLLSAVEMRVQFAQQAPQIVADRYTVRANIAAGSMSVHTDFHLQGNGFSLWHVFEHDTVAVSPQRIGRITQQLLEIETYRMMGLLGLPAARVVGFQLKKAKNPPC
jgi:uncharacterized membrane-anchored protein